MMPQPRLVITIFTILFAEHEASMTSDDFKHLRTRRCPQNTREIPGIFCGRGIGRQDCPGDSECIIERGDGYAICCAKLVKEAIITPSPTILPSFRKVLSSCPSNTTEGDNIFCDNAVGSQDCLRDLECVIDRGDSYAICCPISNASVICCSETTGKAIHSPSMVPSVSEAPMTNFIDANMPPSVSEAPTTNLSNAPTSSEVSIISSPCPSNTRENLNCFLFGSGVGRKNCPGDLECIIEKGDQYAICCLRVEGGN